MLAAAHGRFGLATAAKRAPRQRHPRGGRVDQVTIHRPDGWLLGMRVCLSEVPQRGAVILTVDFEGLAFRAGLRPYDTIMAVTMRGKPLQPITDGYALTSIAPSLVGDMTFCVMRRQWSSEDEAAETIVAAWRGWRTRCAPVPQLSLPTGGGVRVSPPPSPSQAPTLRVDVPPAYGIEGCASPPPLSPLCPSPRSPPTLAIGDEDDSYRDEER